MTADQKRRASRSMELVLVIRLKSKEEGLDLIRTDLQAVGSRLQEGTRVGEEEDLECI